jgi:WD40 repeat protein
MNGIFQLGLILLASYLIPLASAAKKEGREHPTSKGAGKIQNLIEQLGSRDFSTREQASEALRKLGESAWEPLQQALNHSPDPEVRIRAKRLIEAITKTWQVRIFRGHSKLVQGIAFSPDGKYLLAGGLDQTLLMWDLASGRIVQRFVGHTGNVQCVAFTPDGKNILSGSAYGDDTLRLWDVKTGKEIRQFKGHAPPGVLYALQVLPSGKQFVSCGYDKTIRFWDIASGKQLRVIKHWTHPTQNTYVVTFSHDGRYAVLGGQTPQTKLLDLLLEDEVLTLDTQTVEAAFSPRDDYFLTSNPEGDTFFWETKSGQKFLHLREPCHLSPDGRMAVTVSGKFLALPGGKTLFTIPEVKASQFSPNGRYALGRGDSNRDGNLVKMWRISPGP